MAPPPPPPEPQPFDFAGVSLRYVRYRSLSYYSVSADRASRRSRTRAANERGAFARVLVYGRWGSTVVDNARVQFTAPQAPAATAAEQVVDDPHVEEEEEEEEPDDLDVTRVFESECVCRRLVRKFDAM